uniref:Uncharacterized protein n=1 Tax=Kalanchoe fedtschenkoi TaxID=63787 RepID=A0A7N0TIE2_KALFE
MRKRWSAAFIPTAILEWTRQALRSAPQTLSFGSTGFCLIKSYASSISPLRPRRSTMQAKCSILAMIPCFSVIWLK